MTTELIFWVNNPFKANPRKCFSFRRCSFGARSG